MLVNKEPLTESNPTQMQTPTPFVLEPLLEPLVEPVINPQPIIEPTRELSVEPVIEQVIEPQTGDSPSREPQSKEENKLVNGLSTFIGVGLVVFGISAWNLFDIYRGFRSISERNFRLEQLSGVIVHLDEVLTMSARMAAVTGESKWEVRYLKYDPQLVAAIDESTRIAPEAYKNSSVAVNQANNKLVDLEKKSFELVRQGKKKEASQILFSSEYENQKKIYADGTKKTLGAIRTETDQQLQSFSQRLIVSLVFTLLSLPALIAAYLIAVKLIHKYLSDRDRAQKNIASLQIQQAQTEQERAKLEELQQSIAEQERARLELQQSISEQVRERSEVLQQELLTLVSDVEGATSGDLTVRAQISAGEIGIVADFFNAIIESLRDVVRQVKLSAGLVNTSVDTNNAAIRDLAKDANSQAQQLEEALTSVEKMTSSIQQMATSAQQAAKASIAAANNAETGSFAIEQSVQSILQLRQTLAETAKKVKRLGEASQQIAKVVVLIDQIALKTNMLAVNASIEAALAGEEGRGFAVVAEEVGALATQSATATKEIEILVESIQQETSEVVQAMEASTVQVVEGTNRVEEARKSLSQIVQVSRQVNELFKQISLATSNQVEISESVRSLMANLSTQSQKSSETSRNVAIALQETADVASQLQASMQTFKVDAT
jgi:twitching motility protein PilJ